MRHDRPLEQIKFLVNDYASEFGTNIRGWAEGLKISLPSREEAPARQVASARARGLQELYTEETLPEALLEVLNAGVESLVHVVPPEAEAEHAADPARYRVKMVEKLVGVTKAHILRVSESPTHSRMFSFGVHVAAFLFLGLLDDLRVSVAQLTATNPREDNSKRLRVVNRFFRRPDTGQFLRRTVLCLRLAGRLRIACSTPRSTNECLGAIVFAERAL